MNVNKRIEIGKLIADILFNEQLYPMFYEFAANTVHTGSRYDYETYYMRKKEGYTIFKDELPIVHHHLHQLEDWTLKKRVSKKWFDDPKLKEPVLLTKWFEKKQSQIHKIILLKQFLSKMKN